MKPVEEMKLFAKSWLEETYENVHFEYQHKDVFGFDKDGDSTEIEIKVADYDFYKEFRRKSKVRKHIHYVQGIDAPTYFYFYVLSNFTERAIKGIDEFKLPYGLIEYNSLTKMTNIVRKPTRLTRVRRKL